MISERDYNNILATARDDGYDKGHAKGLAEGRAEGRQEGREENKIEMAKNFKSSGISIEVIAACTGLTIEQVNAL